MATTVARLLTITRLKGRRDREHLLAHVLGKPREWLLAHPEAPVQPATVARYRPLVRRLQRGEPLPHLLREHWFYGRPFTVNKHVLIPRPETELMVELALNQTQNAKLKAQNSVIVDVGTGSGCIAVTLAAELPHARVIATDTSATALRVARANARSHGVGNRIRFLRGDLLKPLLKPRGIPRLRSAPRSFARDKFASTLVLANLPYLTTAEWRALPRSLRAYEPRQAFDGGPDGLTPFRKLFVQIRSIPMIHDSLFIILEIDPRRKRALSALVRKTLPTWRASWHKDLAGRWRVLQLQ
ncbi:MAG: peptide chain release factor N(5)-glutamine methyltransferase [bacterium]|nr:peptide chain release factor N(5)-glutamine methyltransferase [bacterium]